MLPFTALRTGVRLVGALAAGGLATLRRPFSASRTYRATSLELLLSLVHFNDVYHLLPRKSEPVGGVSRFYTKLKELEKENDAFITFGGDCFSPGQMATVMRGDHMVPLFKRFGIVCAGTYELNFPIFASRVPIRAQLIAVDGSWVSEIPVESSPGPRGPSLLGHTAPILPVPPFLPRSVFTFFSSLTFFYGVNVQMDRNLMGWPAFSCWQPRLRPRRGHAHRARR